MKVVHWTMFNRSGMNRVAESLAAAEKAIGIDSQICNIHESKSDELIARAADADVHVSHTHFPDWMIKQVTRPLKLVWVGHGTPEHVFQSAVEAGTTGGYGHGDSWMLVQHWLQTADALVTFWPRHQAIWQSLCDKGRVVDLVPLGVDKSFWRPVPSAGRYAGNPSLLTAENSHYIKWALDLFILWPWVYPQVNGNALLHALYVPNDQHRWFFPLVNRNSCSYASHISPLVLSHESLRNALCSVDFYIGLVRYGDFNRLSLEANACGAKTISYVGNPYSDYWLNEGDQRIMANQLVDILNGYVTPRLKESVPDIADTAQSMLRVYERIL